MKINYSLLKKIGIALIVFLVIRYAIKAVAMNSGGGKDTPNPPKNSGTKPPVVPVDPNKADRNKKMYLGLKGSNEVAYLQVWLNTYYAKNLTVDGNFGAKTAAALLATTGKTGGSLNDLGI